MSEAYFKDLGKDERATPKNRQTGDVSISLTIAMLRTTNSSGKASKYQKDTARSIHGIIKKIHGKIHGKQAHKGTGTLTRKSFRRVKRDDGVQEFTIIYSLSIKNT
ncbi:hypothetical protein PL371_05135 [Tenacibaculum maritimum]|nr:hypothetical protein [Tenacibaculum maritimum]MDB0611265.1 hypothetical protein [Tenacibaculum maritimum]